jgi:hypothetical protein
MKDHTDVRRDLGATGQEESTRVTYMGVELIERSR